MNVFLKFKNWEVSNSINYVCITLCQVGVIESQWPRASCARNEPLSYFHCTAQVNIIP